MRYMVLIYASEAMFNNMTEAEQQADWQAYLAFTAEANKRGIMQAGDPLMPTTAATTIRIRDGKKLITDGPFAETKEQLAGYYILNAKDLEEALEVGALLPGAKYGSIEVRPILDVAAQQG